MRVAKSTTRAEFDWLKGNADTATAEASSHVRTEGMAAVKIFISYRRQDGAYVAATVKERLESRFGPDSVFVDIANIPAGSDFRARLQSAVDESDAMLVLIGDSWLKDRSGTSKLFEPEDYVRAELGAALARGIPVVPVLVDGAIMPEPRELPTEIQEFSYRNAAELRPGKDFQAHMARLLDAVTIVVSSTAPILTTVDVIPLKVLSDDTHVAPYIPARKLHGALASYAPHLRPEEILFLYDHTAFMKTAAVGFVLTASALLWRNSFEAPSEVRLRNIETVDIRRRFLEWQLVVNEKSLSCPRRLAQALVAVFDRVKRNRPG